MAEKENLNRPTGSSVGKGCEAIQDPSAKQKLRKPIQEASNSRENAIAVLLHHGPCVLTSVLVVSSS
jgi:hypothetical protein